MKKLSLISLLIITLLAIILTGCEKGDTYSTMTFNEDGSGTKTIYAKFQRDHLFSEANQKSGKVNSSFFPKGQEPVVEWFKEQVPEGFEVDFEEQEDYWVYSITYSFTDLDDYNKKTRQLIKDRHWLDSYLEPAVIEPIDESDNNIVFREQTAILRLSLLGYLEDLHLQTDIFDHTQGGRDNIAPGDHFEPTEVMVSIGSEQAKAVYEWNSLPEYIEVKAKVSDPENFIPSSSNVITSANVSDIGTNNYTWIIISVIVAAVILVVATVYFLMVRKKKS